MPIIKKFVLVLLLAMPTVLFAASPSIESFTQTASTINSGQIASFYWSTLDAGGYSFVIPCAQGVKIKKTDGSAVSCDTKISSTSEGTGGIDLIFYNFSGGIRNVTARVIPKDPGTGADYDAGAQTLSLSVYTSSEPISSFTGTTTVASFAPYTISWSSSILDGTNLTMSCSINIRATSSTYGQGFLPCNTPIFKTDLSGTGSTVLYFNNTSPLDEEITLTLLPAMSPGLYDGEHGEIVSTTVKSGLTPDPVITSFAASTTPDQIADSALIHFSWTINNTSSANLQLSCNSAITATAFINNATTTLPCDKLVSPTALTAPGALDISFSNNNTSAEQISLSLFPGKNGQEFDATRGQTLNLRVLPKGAAPTVVTTPGTTQTQTLSTTTTSFVEGCTSTTRFSPLTGKPCPTVTTTQLPNKKIVTTLRRGSKGEEVRALQLYLKGDPIIYPEGSTDGAFGPATERAVRKFQIKYNIARPGVPGYGVVGPKTRAMLNSLNL